MSKLSKTISTVEKDRKLMILTQFEENRHFHWPDSLHRLQLLVRILAGFWLSPLHFPQIREECMFPSRKNVYHVVWSCYYYQSITLALSNNFYMHSEVVWHLDSLENDKKVASWLFRNYFFGKDFIWLLTVSPSFSTNCKLSAPSKYGFFSNCVKIINFYIWMRFFRCVWNMALQP